MGLVRSRLEMGGVTRAAALLLLLAVTAFAELPQFMEERSSGMRTGVGLEDEADILERSVTLDICAVQRRVLERLRELVVDSIHQVKQCMALSNQYRFKL